MFVDELGRHVDDFRLRRRFHNALEPAGLPKIRLHDLRHTFGTLAVQVFALTDVSASDRRPESGFGTRSGHGRRTPMKQPKQKCCSFQHLRNGPAWTRTRDRRIMS